MISAALLEQSRQLAFPMVDLSDVEPDRNLLPLISVAMAEEHQVLPLALSTGRLLLACKAQDSLTAQDYFARVVGMEVLPVLCDAQELSRAISRHYLDEGYSSAQLGAKALQSVRSTLAPALPEAPATPRETPVAELVEHLFRQALRLRASDIHLEPDASQPQLRYRIDGALTAQPAIPFDVYPAVVSRIKLMASLDIAERRRPQDGRITFAGPNANVDLRVSVIPMLEGESVVIRILSQELGPRDVEGLGLPPLVQKEWMRLASLPHGIVLVTGPTGSGKTTTLYSTLRAIRHPEKKIITLEDPVEAKIDGVSQIPVRSELGFDFAKGLRSVLRHDPDVLLVGEIRDLETAQIAVAASLTGHLLFSTLHTNSASQAVIRLMDMGLAGYQVMTALAGVLAQRLMRRLCDGCKRPHPFDPRDLGLDENAPWTVYQPSGCPACAGIGYKGRIGVYELLTITPKMRRLGDTALHSSDLEALAGEHGFCPMSSGAEHALRSGLTSLSEYVNLVGKDAI